MAAEPPSTTRHTFDPASSIALTAAAYFVLRTALDLKRTPDGKWSFHLQIKPAGDAAVKALIEKFISYLP